MLNTLDYVKPGMGIVVKERGLLGNNTANDATTLNSLLASIGSTPIDLHFPAGTYKLSTNVTQPSNVRFIMANGAMFSIDNGVSLSLNGGFEAGLEQKFTGNGTVTGSPKVECVYPEWFGAIGDGITNDSSAFSKCWVFCDTRKLTCQLTKDSYHLGGLEITLGNLKIIGAKRSTLIEWGKVTITGDIYLDNLIIQDFTRNYCINIIPSGFSNIYINNVRNVNSIISTSRAFRFIVCSVSTTATGIDNVIIQNSYFSNYYSDVIYLRCYIKKGLITGNKFFEIGNLNRAGVTGVLLGYQDSGGGENAIPAPAQEVTISNNHFENLYSVYGEDETSEGHFILVYGFNVIIRDNYCKNMYSGGTQEQHLDGGWDHEGIYTKCHYATVENNYLENATGDCGEGAICCKATSQSKITGNVIKGIFGSGINSTSGHTVIRNNIITLTEIPAKLSYSDTFGIRTNGSNGTNIVEGNIVNHMRVIKTRKSIGISASECLRLKCMGNYVYSSTDYAFYQTGGIEGAVSEIINNTFDVLNGEAMTCVDSLNIGIDTIISNNKFIYSRNNATATYLLDIQDLNGKFTIEDNYFKISGILSALVALNGLQYGFNKNTIFIDDTVLTPAYQALRITTDVSKPTSFNSICQNTLEGVHGFTNFVACNRGDNSGVGYNIGTLKISENRIALDGGSLVGACSINAEKINTEHLIITNNFIRTTNPIKTIATSAIPSDGLFDFNNDFTAGTTILDDIDEQINNASYSTQASSSLNQITLPSSTVDGVLNLSVQGRTASQFLKYTPVTWTGWTLAGGASIVNGNIRFAGSNTASLDVPLIKTSTKYGLLVDCPVSTIPSNNSAALRLGTNLRETPEGIKPGFGATGMFKYIFTTKNSIVTRKMDLSITSGASTNYDELRNIALFELPTGSEIESDFNNMTATQLYEKYGYFQTFKSLNKSRIVSTDSNGLNESKLYLPYPMRSTSTTVYDILDSQTGVLTKNVSDETTLSNTDYEALTNSSNVNIVTTKVIDSVVGTSGVDGVVRVFNKDGLELTEIVEANANNSNLIDVAFYYDVDKKINLITTGTRQQIDANFTAAATASGNLTMVVTAANMVGSPVTITVPVTSGDSTSTVKGKLQTALLANSTIIGFFDIVSVSSTRIGLKAKHGVADDVTMSLKMTDAGGTGVAMPDSWTQVYGAALTIENARTNLGTITIVYKLPTSETIYLYPGGLYTSSNGIIYQEPYIEDVSIYDNTTKLSVVDTTKPITELLYVNKINKDNGELTSISLDDCQVDGTGLIITISGAIAGEYYEYGYNYSDSLCLNGTLNYSYNLNLKAQTNSLTNRLRTLEDDNQRLKTMLDVVVLRLNDLETP